MSGVTASEEAVVLFGIGIFLLFSVLILFFKCALKTLNDDDVADVESGKATSVVESTQVPSSKLPDSTSNPQLSSFDVGFQPRKPFPLTPNPFLTTNVCQTAGSPLHQPMDESYRRPPPLSTPSTSKTLTTMKTTPTADSARSVTPRRKSQRKSPEMNDQISDVADMMAINQVTSAEVARANQLDSATHQFRPMPISAEAIGLPKAKSTDTTGKDSGVAAKTPESIGMKTDVTQTPDSGREKQKRNQK